MDEPEANQYNLLDQPYFYLGAVALLGKGRDNFLSAYKFDVNPATDNRPYFFDFFKWHTLRESLSLKGQGGLTFLELGYPLLIATLLQAVLLSFLSVLGPLVAFHREELPWGINGSLVFYFFSLGLAFLFVEMAFIQKFVLFLHHPIYAATVVISAFLFFAGLGSGFSKRISTSLKGCFPGHSGFVVALVVAGISFLCLLYIFLLPEIFHHWISKSNIVKVPICVLLIAPLAFLMGTPFPLGLSAVAGTAPNFIPWAWGVNGCASVISPILAILLSVHFGFNAVLVTAMLLYVSAAFSLHITKENLRSMLIRAGTSESNFH
jgi:hypothetical protein